MRSRAVAVAGLLALLAGCASAPDGDQPAATATPAAEVLLRPCPEQPQQRAGGAQTLPALAFDCPGGGALDLGLAPGVPTLVNLWGSWCPPCREELPLLQQFADLAADRVQVVGVISKDGLPQADAFATDAGITFPQAFDGEGELMTELGLNALPFTYFVDGDGRLAHTQVGPVESVDEIRALVAEHLGVQL